MWKKDSTAAMGLRIAINKYIQETQEKVTVKLRANKNLTKHGSTQI